MSKFWIALGLVATIIVENWVWPGWMAFAYHWSIGFSPWYVQLVVLIILSALAAFAAAEILGGIIGIPILAILVILPLLGFRLGWVDDELGDVARQLATNSRDVQEVAHVHTYLHTGLILLVTAVLILCVLAAVRRVRG